MRVWPMIGSAGGLGGSGAGRGKFLVAVTFHATGPISKRVIRRTPSWNGIMGKRR